MYKIIHGFAPTALTEIFSTMIPIQSMHLKKQDVVIRQQSLAVRVAHGQYLIGGVLLISRMNLILIRLTSIAFVLTPHAS